MIKISKLFTLLIVVGFLLRIVTMFWSFNFRENTDVLRYRDWARISYLYGFADTYNPTHLSFGTIANNQPPGSLYVISAMYNLQINAVKAYLHFTNVVEGSNQFINGPFIDIFLRLPSLIGDILLTFLIYILVKQQKTEKYALFASSLFFFNPVIIYNSSFWGQMDAVNNLFFYFSVFLIVKNKYALAILFYVLSLFIKLSLLPLLPVFLMVLLLGKKVKQKAILIGLAISLLVILVLTLPFTHNPFQWWVNFALNNSVGEIKNITIFALNFWWFLFMPFIVIGKPTSAFSFSEIRLLGSPLSDASYFGVSLTIWSLLLFLLISLPILWRAYKSTNYLKKPEGIFLLLAIFSLVSYLFLPRMHERYMYPFFPLFATFLGFIDFKKSGTLFYIALSVLNMLNLYLVWHPMYIPIISYEIMNNGAAQWFLSLLTVYVGSLVYFYSFQKISKHEKV